MLLNVLPIIVRIQLLHTDSGSDSESDSDSDSDRPWQTVIYMFVTKGSIYRSSIGLCLNY
jgi:hypothetical protein